MSNVYDNSKKGSNSQDSKGYKHFIEDYENISRLYRENKGSLTFPYEKTTSGYTSYIGDIQDKIIDSGDNVVGQDEVPIRTINQGIQSVDEDGNIKVEYFYEAKIVDIEPDSPPRFEDLSQKEQKEIIYNLKNKPPYVDVEGKFRYVAYPPQMSRTGPISWYDEKYRIPLTDKELDKILNPPSPNQNQQSSNTSTIVIEVSNNAGLPTFDYVDELFDFNASQYPLIGGTIDDTGLTEKINNAIEYVQLVFNNNPPRIEAPGARIYSINPDTEDITIEEDYFEQKYPTEGSLVEFIDEGASIPYTFHGSVVDAKTGESLDPDSKTLIEDQRKNYTYADKNGKFSIKGEYAIGEIVTLTFSNDKALELNSNKKYYNPNTIPIITSNGQFISKTLFELYPNPSTSQSNLKVKLTPDSEKKILEEEEIKNFVGVIVSKAIDEISNRLYPFIINKLLTEPFGIEDPIELIEKAKKALTNEKNQYKKSLKKLKLPLTERNGDEVLTINGELPTLKFAGDYDEIIWSKDEINDFTLFIQQLEPFESFTDSRGDIYTIDQFRRIFPGDKNTFLSDKFEVKNNPLAPVPLENSMLDAVGIPDENLVDQFSQRNDPSSNYRNYGGPEKYAQQFGEPGVFYEPGTILVDGSSVDFGTYTSVEFIEIPSPPADGAGSDGDRPPPGGGGGGGINSKIKEGLRTYRMRPKGLKKQILKGGNSIFRAKFKNKRRTK